MQRSTLYSGIVAVASLVTLVACQDNGTSPIRAGSASYAKGPGGGTPAPTTTPPASVTGGTGAASTAGGEVAIYGSPCDIIVLAPGNLPVANQTAVFASAGQVVKLYAAQGAAAGGEFTCHVVADAASPTGNGLSSGEGLIIQAPGVTLDLNGTKLHSDADAFALTNGTGENHGFIVKSDNVTVTNSSAEITTVDAFTVGGALAQASNIKLIGQRSATPAAASKGSIGYNIQLGLSGGLGSSLKVDRVTGGTVQSISALNTNPNSIESRGVAVVRSVNVLFTDVDVEGQASGIRFRDTQTARIENSFACGPVMGPVEFDRGNTNVTSLNISVCAQ
jgi:hypothetical protein